MVELKEWKISPVETKSHLRKLQDTLKAKSNEFPINSLPIKIQEIIMECNQTEKFPVDFIAASLLYGCSVAIGNSRKAKFQNQSAVLYMAIVGNAGTNKSHPLNWAMKPLNKMDSVEYKAYEQEMKDFQNDSSDTAMKPIWRQTIISDFTTEAVAQVHKYNQRGLGVYCDELAAWLKNFNRYNNGSSEEFWLSVWSGTPYRVNRKTAENIFNENPFISVIGTIQPKVLEQLGQNRRENGFLDRILFIYPKNIRKTAWTMDTISKETETDWGSIIEKLMQLPLAENNLMPFTHPASELIMNWQKKLTEFINNEKEELAGIAAKIEQYVIRFSLILELMNYASTNEGIPDGISIKSVECAILLAEYFFKMAVDTGTTINDPRKELSGNKRKFYNELNNEFTTLDAISLGIEYEIQERDVYRLLKNTSLFNKISKGQYQKTIVSSVSSVSHFGLNDKTDKTDT